MFLVEIYIKVYLKMRIFWKKLKITSAFTSDTPFASGGPPHPDPRDFTPTYYYNFVEFVFSI